MDVRFNEDKLHTLRRIFVPQTINAEAETIFTVLKGKAIPRRGSATEVGPPGVRAGGAADPGATRNAAGRPAVLRQLALRFIIGLGRGHEVVGVGPASRAVSVSLRYSR